MNSFEGCNRKGSLPVSLPLLLDRRASHHYSCPPVHFRAHLSWPPLNTFSQVLAVLGNTNVLRENLGRQRFGVGLLGTIMIVIWLPRPIRHPLRDPFCCQRGDDVYGDQKRRENYHQHASDREARPPPLATDRQCDGQ